MAGRYVPGDGAGSASVAGGVEACVAVVFLFLYRDVVTRGGAPAASDPDRDSLNVFTLPPFRQTIQYVGCCRK